MINTTNFFWRFILDFNKIAIFFISILRTTWLSDALVPKTFEANDNKDVKDISNKKANKMNKNLF